MIDLRDLTRDVSAQLWAVYHQRPDAPELILPLKRGGVRRVSEQESKILITQWLQTHGQPYSIETPTIHQYRQSGQAQLSARIDVTVYGSRDAEDRAFNFELKAGTASPEAFRKDFEKLLREETPGLWFHTLEAASIAAWSTLEAKMTDALSRLSTHADAASHTIHFAFCVLDVPELVEFDLDFADGWRDRLGPALARGRALALHPEWTPDSKRCKPAKKPIGASYTGGRRKLLVLIPSIDPTTFFHLSIQGDSYYLRSFGGKRGFTKWKEPGLNTTSELLAAHPAAIEIDVAAERQDLGYEQSYWIDRISALNRQHGIG